MTEEEYKAAIEQYKAEHSAGGSLEHGEWKKHKYIRIENGRYIYPEDLKKTAKNKVSETLNAFKTAGQKIGQAVQEHRSEAEAKKAAADAMKVGRTATQQYKESGQYEKDVADEKAKRETMTRQDEAKKITSLTPDEARKRAAELSDKSGEDKARKEVSDDLVKRATALALKYNTEKDPNSAPSQYQVLVKYNKNGIATEIKMVDNSGNYPTLSFGNPSEMSSKELNQYKEDRLKATKKQEESEKPKGESLVKEMDFDAEEKRINGVLTNQDKNGSSVKTETVNKSEAPKLEDSNTEKQSEAEKNLKEMARKYAHYANLTKNVNTGGTSTEWSNLVKAAKEYAEETGEDYRKVLEKALEDSKKIQHSYTDPKSFYAAVYDYKQAHKR